MATNSPLFWREIKDKGIQTWLLKFIQL